MARRQNGSTSFARRKDNSIIKQNVLSSVSSGADATMRWYNLRTQQNRGYIAHLLSDSCLVLKVHPIELG
ncbi:hypothetical protein KIN20_020561 [Parelaphostrongylus tenuis]|uniref:Uncharacterized protein n=1 Tax=Parelaphostrongylus tenuis TaxID=148309 RepID=A0AAD5QTK8_PARTN|nr:hypothetical protein KIN20_020561 [Parelaphostrongylus tenuis]